MTAPFRRLEEVADGELEVERTVDEVSGLVLPPVEGDAPLEPERPDRAHPADAEPDRLVERQRDVGIAPLIPAAGAAGAREDDGPDPRGLEERELQLEVQDRLLVPADVRRDRRPVGGAGRAERGGDRVHRVAAAGAP